MIATRLLTLAAYARRDGRAEDEAALIEAILAVTAAAPADRPRVREGLLESVTRLAAYAVSLFWNTPAELDAQALPN